MIELPRPRALSSPAQPGAVGPPPSLLPPAGGSWVPTPSPAEAAGAPGAHAIPCHTPKLVRVTVVPTCRWRGRSAGRATRCDQVLQEGARHKQSHEGQVCAWGPVVTGRRAGHKGPCCPKRSGAWFWGVCARGSGEPSGTWAVFFCCIPVSLVMRTPNSVNAAPPFSPAPALCLAERLPVPQ